MPIRANCPRRHEDAGPRWRRALVTEPDILLMDEPFAALDEITRFRLNDDLLTLWRSLGKTVIFVTHSVFESVYLSQRVVVMTQRPGRIGAGDPYRGRRTASDGFQDLGVYADYCRKVSARWRRPIRADGAMSATPEKSEGEGSILRGLRILLPAIVAVAERRPGNC